MSEHPGNVSAASSAEAAQPAQPADLRGTVALVTGASRGIGRQIALRLAQCGARVAAIARSAEALTGTVEAIETAGGQARPYPCDIKDSAAVEAVVERIEADLEKIDILVNNAGLTRDGLLLRMDDDQWQEVIDTNLKGTFLFIRQVARGMIRRRSGRIINITSVVGITGNAGQANYAASKAGLIGLTKTAARELGGRGITVNAVAPGFIDTDMTRVLPEKVRDELIGKIPLRRMGTPDDIADMVCYLAGRSTGYITGQVISVDGGMT